MGSQIGAAFAVMTGAGVLLGGAGMAQAETQSFSVDTNASLSQTLSFAQFDTSLGTLNSINFTLSPSNTTGSATAGITGGEGHATASLSGTLDITGPGAELLFSAGTSVFASCSVPTGHNPCNAGPNAENNPTFTNPAVLNTNLSAFEGTGTVDLGASIDGFFNGNTFTPGQVQNGVPSYTDNLAWNGQLALDYNYTPATPPTDVPEPASMALLGMGIAGLGFLRRKR